MKKAVNGFVLAITGGMSAGKSTLASVLRRKGAAYLSMDELAHSLYEPGKPVFGAILRAFGRGVLSPSGAIDRGKLGRMVFGNPRALEKLDRIVHPALRREGRAAIARMRRTGRVVVVESGPLLFRLGLDRLADAVVLVKAERGQRLDRLISGRGLARRDALARLESSDMAEKELGKRVNSVRRSMVIDASGPVERNFSVATRILGMVKRWR